MLSRILALCLSIETPESLSLTSALLLTFLESQSVAKCQLNVHLPRQALRRLTCPPILWRPPVVLCPSRSSLWRLSSANLAFFARSSSLREDILQTSEYQYSIESINFHVQTPCAI